MGDVQQAAPVVATLGAASTATRPAVRAVRPMGGIRPMVASDLGHVAEIHRRAHSPDEPASDALTAAYSTYLRHVFLDNPVKVDGIGPLVFEQKGRVVGFIGIVPKQIRVGDKVMTAAVSSQFAVDPESNVGLAGLGLLKALFDGPQDLSIADTALDVSHRLWTRFGGGVSALHSMNWIRPLRPARFAVTTMMEGSTAGRILSPVASTVDRAAYRFQRSRGSGDDALHAEGIDVDGLLTAMESKPFRKTVAASYTAETLAWQLDLAARMDAGRQVDCIACTAGGGGLAGWHIGYLGGDGVYELIDFAAADGHALGLFDHVSAHARRRGATALAGRMQSELVNVLPSGRGILMRRHDWVLVDAKDPEVLEPICRGDMALSRLDGEICLGFSGWHPEVSGKPRIAGPV